MAHPSPQQNVEKVVISTRPSPGAPRRAYPKQYSRFAQGLNERPWKELLWQLGAGGGSSLRLNPSLAATSLAGLFEHPASKNSP